MKQIILSILFIFLPLFVFPDHPKSFDLPLPYIPDARGGRTPQHTESALPEDWYKGGVFYELFIREFLDTDGDSDGDIQGVIDRLDYLEELGIRGIWFMPVTESYDNDHGYTTLDYMNIESDYGSMEDFRRLIDACHQRGMGVVIDLVINHCSYYHPYFQEALRDRESPKRDWFIFSPIRYEWRAPWQDSYLVDSDLIYHHNESELWYTWHSSDEGDYFYGTFSKGLPDFNYRNEEVYRYMLDVMMFWLDMGVDGFRIDAARHLVENSEKERSNTPETFAVFEGMRKLTDLYDNRILIAEGGEIGFIGNGRNRVHTYFNFKFTEYVTRALVMEDISAVVEDIANLERERGEGSYSCILSNHDAFSGPRPVSRFSGDRQMAKLAASLLLTMPGMPFIYYGEEIGMTNSPRYDYDWAVRTPMQWNSERHAGFTEAEIISPRRVNRDYRKVNVQYEEREPESMLAFYRQLVGLRNNHPAISSGSIDFITKEGSFFHYIREKDGKRIHVFINCSASRTEEYTYPGLTGMKILLYSGQKDYDIRSGKIELPEHSVLIGEETPNE